MIKSYAITIDEIDDADVAERQAREKVSACALMTNTIGIVLVHPEFIAEGICERVAAALPFPTVGMTTISHCAGGVAGTYAMSIFILTSDDCRFSHALSDAVDDAGNSTMDIARKCYDDALAKLNGEEPRLALLYAPLLDKINVGPFVMDVTSINGNLPIFGAISNYDMTTTDEMHGARVFFDGRVYDNRYALTLISGDVAPKFYIASVTEDAVLMPNVGVVTKACGNKLAEINGTNATQFLKNVGFLAAEPEVRDKGLQSSIFALKLSDGLVLSRIPIKVDDGGVYCGGQIVEGATLSIAFNTKESVLESTEQLMKEIKEDHSGGTVIINTCLGRRFGLLSEPMDELNAISRHLGNDFCFAAAYVNGELCPIALNENGARNLDHNQTIIACVI